MDSKHTKRALLSSALALVLCFTMLIGTTFAWFTDTASTNVNTIQAGTLKVALEMYENGQWVDAEGKTLNFTRLEDAPATVSDNANDGKVLVQSADILWEPGCTYKLPTLRVRNDGNLALKYKIEITGINGDAKLNEAIEWTIDKGLNEALVEGTTDQWFLLAGNESSHNMVISGHMKESAGNEYQGLSIEGVAITVYATQYTYEYDMNGNQYDADAKYDEPWDGKTKTAPALVEGVYHITNAAELVYAMEHSTPQMIGYNGNEYVFGKYVLESNIDLGGATVTGFACDGSTNFQGSFDGQGYTISNFTIDNAAKTYYGGLFGYLYSATVENLTVKNAVVIGQKQVGVLVGAASDSSTVTNCNVYNSTVIATKKVGAVVGYALGSTVTDCYAENCNVYCKELYDEDSIKQADAVLGYQNTGCTVSGNDDKNVTVKQVYIAGTDSDLEAALDATDEIINIILTNDVTVNAESGTQWTNAFGGDDTDTVTIDGQGKYTLTFNQPNSDWNHVVTNGARLVLKDLDLTNSGNNNGPWNKHDIVFDCAVELENVSSDKAIALCDNATLKNVTIADANTDSTYALWIQAKGQTVELDKLTIKNVGGDTRAIAIKDQYVTSPAKVKLTIKNSTIASEKKAAILVTSTAGATITAENVNISGVKADSTNLVWVDSGYAYQNIDEVTVTGGTAVVEQ